MITSVEYNERSKDKINADDDDDRECKLAPRRYIIIMCCG